MPLDIAVSSLMNPIFLRLMVLVHPGVPMRGDCSAAACGDHANHVDNQPVAGDDNYGTAIYVGLV